MRKSNIIKSVVVCISVVALAACGSVNPSEEGDVRPEHAQLNGKADGMDWLTQPAPSTLLGCPLPIPSPTFPQPAYSQQVSGEFNGYDSAHMYRLMGNAGQDTTLAFEGSYPAYYGAAIAIYDADGNKVAGKRNDGSNQAKLTFAPAVDGQYMVAVYTVSTYAFGNYTLQLQCGGSNASCDAQDAQGQGMCMMWMGYKWDGQSCVGISGCSCVGSDCGALYQDHQACEAAHSQCQTTSCWGSWLDQLGNCRGPADGVLPDSCCDDERDQKCGDISTKYYKAVLAAKTCSPFAFAPQCMTLVDSSLGCNGCPTAINTTADAAGLTAIKAEWNQLQCSKNITVCPMLMCAPPTTGICDSNTNTCGY